MFGKRQSFIDAYLERTPPESHFLSSDSFYAKLVFGVRHGGGSYSRKAYHVYPMSYTIMFKCMVDTVIVLYVIHCIPFWLKHELGWFLLSRSCG